tara:strand:- start:626 stop:910 length:285 start_codon:yes stop_codon:yes gene_type:complete
MPTYSYIGTALKICVERVDKKGRKKVSIESYPDCWTANSRITMYSLCGIKAWPYYRKLKKPKKLKLPKNLEENSEEEVIVNSKENEYALSTESV